MADAILQIYKTIMDYQRGYYPDFPFEFERRIYPVVVTLENWHLFGPAVLPTLEKAVRDKLHDAGLGCEVLEEMPFSVWHIGDLEWAVQIINEIQISKFFDHKLRNSEMRTWEWQSYMDQLYAKKIKYRNLFGKEYESIFESIGFDQL